MAQSSPLSPAEQTPDSLEARALKQQQTYWRIRIAKTLEKLDTEARRMLALEAELAEFAAQYYTAVGEHAERLAALEHQFENPTPREVAPRTMDDVLATREMKHARAAELKTRYRTLAKEIHPDRGMATQNTDARAAKMQSLNVAYTTGDLATLLRLEAEMLLTQESTDLPALEDRLREVEQAALTYAKGYSQLLHSPLNELMLRQFSARLAGWDWTQAVVRRVQHAIAAQERAIVQAQIAAIGDWRHQMRATAA